jgi:cytochrome b561
MSRRSPDFHPALRVLHWLMAAMVLAMLFIGVFMVSTTGPAYVALLDLHRPIGIAILVLVLLRRCYGSPPARPPCPRILRRCRSASQDRTCCSMRCSACR